MNRLDGAAVFAFRDSKYLLQRRARGCGAGTWSVPGGRLEPGESPLDAALRELFEETGLKPTGVMEYRDTVTVNCSSCGEEWATHWFRCEVEGEPVINEESTAFAWCPPIPGRLWPEHADALLRLAAPPTP